MQQKPLYQIEFSQVKIGLLQYLDKEGRSSASEPEIIEHDRIKHVKNAERIIDTHHISVVEVIPVIHTGETFQAKPPLSRASPGQ